MNIKFDKEKIMNRLRIAVKRAVAVGAMELQTEAKSLLNRKNSSLTGGGIPSSPGEPPANASGALGRSIVSVDATQTPNKPHYKVGTSLKYARIQEYGGRITAKKGKFLAIPVGLDGKRAARDCGGDLRKLKLRLVVTKNHRLLLVKDLMLGRKAAKGSEKAIGQQSVILFVLKKSVILPARPFMRPAYATKKAAIAKRIADAVSTVLKGAA